MRLLNQNVNFHEMANLSASLLYQSIGLYCWTYNNGASSKFPAIRRCQSRGEGDGMWHGARVILLAALGLLAGPSVAELDKKFNITIGYLPSIKGELRDRQGLAISGALSMALEDVNNSTKLLPDVKLLLKWNDTRCDTVTATRMLTDMTCSGVVAFFGPEGRCHTEAIVAMSRNLPMISYGNANVKIVTDLYEGLDDLNLFVTEGVFREEARDTKGFDNMCDVHVIVKYSIFFFS
ncbi:jg17584 [Pararge aegeria aegeria]|uniref:Jg17584 protein n=1 Tax=Pararge aegeria aegeria TaxID=348720 RepID=A0A8S4RPB1_9NEOP|nr:jg17584 [Pararge aegeria aegeria]